MPDKHATQMENINKDYALLNLFILLQLLQEVVQVSL